VSTSIKAAGRKKNFIICVVCVSGCIKFQYKKRLPLSIFFL
jgi:hypothetical protein